MENDRLPCNSGRTSRWTRAAASFIFLLFLTILLSACQIAPSRTSPGASQENQDSPTKAATVFSAQETLLPSEEMTGTTAEMTAISSPTEFPVSTLTPLPFGSCTDGLTFMGDLTFPDRTKVLPGQRLEKSWKVRNSGQCDWGPEYRFRWTGGTHLAAQDEFALYPAAAGGEAAIVIPMTAPTVPGEYTSDWRAVSPLGVPFGDSLYIDIVVAP